MSRKSLLLTLLVLFLSSPLFSGVLRVESGYAETLSPVRCFLVDASWEGSGWEAGYRFRYPSHDVGARWETGLPRKFRFTAKGHLNTSTFVTYNLDAVVAIGQLFEDDGGRWSVSYSVGLQMSQFLSARTKDQPTSFAIDYHASFTRRFFENRLGATLSLDSSDLYWYNYYIFGSLFSLKIDCRATENIALSLEARCRVTDLLVENRYLSMISFLAGVDWRLP